MTTIQTRLGPVTGAAGENTSVFLGIPYAAPPVGQQRWMSPVSAAAWPEGLDATRYPNRSFQPPYPPVLAGREIPGEFSVVCLYLNIYTPAADEKKRPVMFWIHGGAYIQGSANEYDGTALAAENDVVVVIINYRLGIFGFMDLSGLGTEFEGSASLGFQDQIAALQWVSDNIADYGGDPDNVTIFGESAGGGSVLGLLAAPSATGLFHKAIGFSPAEPSGAPIDNLTSLSERFEARGTDLLTKLRELDAETLFALQVEGGVSTGATVDGHIITDKPADAIRKRGQSGVPLIVGCNKDEGSFMADVFPPEMAAAVPLMFGVQIGNGDATNYLAHLDTLVPDGDSREKLVRIWYDLFRASTLRCAEASSLSGPGGWVYNFDVPGSTPLGAAHGCDVGFTFNAIGSSEPGLGGFHEPTDFNKDIAVRWSRTFATFARTGNPNGAGLPEWSRYEPVQRACLVVDDNPHVVNDPDGDGIRATYGME